MPFPRAVKDELLVKAHRHCCICHKNAGTNMEVHHIVPEANGGNDSRENGIPLCLDCHANVEHYNVRHPRGNKFTPEELRKHRDQWFAITSVPEWQQRPGALVPVGPSQPVQSLLDRLGKAELWNPDNRSFLGSVRVLSRAERDNLVAGIVEAMTSEDEDRRWDAAIVVEYLAEWDPQFVPDSLLAGMAGDDLFSVRSSAAVSFYYLASAAPARVPVDTLAALARLDEDWYVMTPAMSALRRLVRTRSVAAEVLLEGARDDDDETADRYADELRKLIGEHPAVASWNTIELLEQDTRPFVREVGELWRAVLGQRQRDGLPTDLGIF